MADLRSSGQATPWRFGRVLLALSCCWSRPRRGRMFPIPPLKQRVTDQTGTLTPEQVSALEAKLAAFEQRKGSQIFVLIVPTTAPESIEQYRDQGGGCLEARPQGRGRRCAAAGCQGRPGAAHRHALRPGGGDSRCRRQPDRGRHHGAALPVRRFLRRDRCRRGRDDQADRWRAAAAAASSGGSGRSRVTASICRPCLPSASCSSSSWAGCCARCWAACRLPA